MALIKNDYITHLVFDGFPSDDTNACYHKLRRGMVTEEHEFLIVRTFHCLLCAIRFVINRNTPICNAPSTCCIHSYNK